MCCFSREPHKTGQLHKHSMIATMLHVTKDQDRHHSPSRTLRVLAVGDCNTCGITVPPIGNTILDKFCEQLEDHGYTTARQNLGCGMATTREGVQRMRLDAQPADTVLINFGLVDTWITSIPRVYVPYYPDTWRRKRLRKLLKFVKRRLLRSPALRHFIPIGTVVSLDEYDQNIRDILLEQDPENMTQATRDLLKKHGRTMLADAEKKFKAGIIAERDFNIIKISSIIYFFFNC